MSTTAISSKDGTAHARPAQIDMKLEVVLLPVTDIERAKAFYSALGWRLDADFTTPTDHVIQFTPPGSECSVHFGTNLTTAAPGSAQGLFLVASDIQAARRDLLERGVQVSEVFHFAGWNRIAPDARVSGPAPHSYGSFVSFNDPDGNGWLVQEVTTGCPAASAAPTRHSPRQAIWRAPSGGRRPPTASTRSAPGQADANWPDWYAAYMVEEQSGGPLPR